MEDRLLRVPEVMALTQLARPTIYSLIKRGKFPMYHKLGRTTVWRLSEIQEFIANLGK